MKYYIHLGCRTGYHTAYKVDEDIFEKLMDTIKGCTECLYGSIDDLWYDYQLEDQNAFEQCALWQRYYIADSVDWYVTDENGKTVYDSNSLGKGDYFELRELPNNNEEKQPQYDNGLWFERSTLFRHANWLFSLELDNEEFDSDKLYFKKLSGWR